MRSAAIPFSPRRGEVACETAARGLRSVLPRGWKAEVRASEDEPEGCGVCISWVTLLAPGEDGEREEVAWGAAVSDLRSCVVYVTALDTAEAALDRAGWKTETTLIPLSPRRRAEVVP